MFGVAHRAPRSADQGARRAAAGASWFEVDVQLRGDTVVVSHYLPVRRTGGRVERDNALLRLHGGPPRDPTLQEVLTRIPPGCRVLLDPKGRATGHRERLVEALADELPDRGRFCVSTNYGPDLSGYPAAGFGLWLTIGDAAHLRRVLQGGPLAQAGVSVRHLVLDEAAVAALKQRTGTVVAWTVQSPARARRLGDWGVDGITTDRVAVLHAAQGR